MSEFELVTIALSFVVGFGVAAILGGFASLLTRPQPVRWDWLPLAWALLVLAEQVMFWFGALYVERTLTLSLGTFWALILLASLLFLAGALILPSNEHRLELALIEDFDRFGIRALIPLAVFQACAAVTNLAAGASPLEPDVYLNLTLAFLALAVFAIRHRTAQRGLTLTYGAILLYGLIFVWARPGALDHVIHV